MSVPNVIAIEQEVPAAATGADAETDLREVQNAGTVTAVSYVPATVLTGVDTNSRTLVLVNKGQSGSGTTIVASKAFTNGVNAPADDITAITLSGTPANLVVAAGDVLAWQSNHIGTGLADPGGLAHVEITRGDLST